MNSKKANIDNDDLKFIPLNIDSSLSPNGSKFPILYNLDGLSHFRNIWLYFLRTSKLKC